MLINRSNLTLSFPSCKVRCAYMPSTNEHLIINFNSLQNQMRKMPTCHFKEKLGAPDYSGMRQSGFFAMNLGFQLNNHSHDVFIHARRETPQCQGEFAGDKFHISVLGDMVPQAFQALSGLLFSEDSPIDKWKVTDMEQVNQQDRVGLGAQLTLYIKPDQKNSQYSVSSLLKIRQFIERLESRLSENGLVPGQYPESDVRPENWKYCSYRNELRSERDGGVMQNQALREEPFYRLMIE